MLNRMAPGRLRRVWSPIQSPTTALIGIIARLAYRVFAPVSTTARRPIIGATRPAIRTNHDAAVPGETRTEGQRPPGGLIGREGDYQNLLTLALTQKG